MRGYPAPLLEHVYAPLDHVAPAVGLAVELRWPTPTALALVLTLADDVWDAPAPQQPTAGREAIASVGDEALRKRLKRKYGEFSGFWRLGIQRRGAWHFHVLLFVPPSFGSLKELRHFIASSWYQVCGEVSEGHLQAGTRVEEIRRWRSATSYVERYLAKPEQFPEGVETGRVWGVWNEELLPVQWETVRVSLKDDYRIRRIYRRLAKMRGRGHVHRLTVFVRYENVVRLLEFLEYRQDE